ncbi:PREDICTED: epidermal growth factor-like protein 6 [Chrysochloris asiatica]|uniref:Epidermal growth factor-like protein 6 n=1 Tax=Chrysochloris asiatica TaxID=185453 RepID=A0A9B0WJY7_CHRAS|nr:PREDICTED: epidermal growth factor-like protein 6 [Chrysochloris asiatica]
MSGSCWRRVPARGAWPALRGSLALSASLCPSAVSRPRLREELSPKQTRRNRRWSSCARGPRPASSGGEQEKQETVTDRGPCQDAAALGAHAPTAALLGGRWIREHGQVSDCLAIGPFSLSGVPPGTLARVWRTLFSRCAPPSRIPRVTGERPGVVCADLRVSNWLPAALVLQKEGKKLRTRQKKLLPCSGCACFPATAPLPAAFQNWEEKAALARTHGLSARADQPGVCRYGAKLACCHGWRRKSNGDCEATCIHGCKFGECVGPNKCRCFPGYTGKTCSQDENECGFNPRPCPHRCVNTLGSYKCFCLSGFMLMPDATCVNSQTCALTSCQYGCEETEGGPRCLCPSSGLRLAPDGRVCTDIDECASGKAICPYNRRCVNTFGSYYCKCHVGFELKYIHGRYDCVDLNECAVNTHPCSLHANCLNTQGSFKCKCKQGYKGNGLQCSVIPENSVKEIHRVPSTVKDTIKKLLAHKKSMRKKEKINNAIPECTGTPAPKVNLQPFNYEENVYQRENANGDKKGPEERKEMGLGGEKRDEKALKNHVEQEQRLRGDVFSPKVDEANEFGLVVVQRKPLTSKLEHTDFNISADCSFDHGICDWKQDIEDDFDWSPADRDNAVGHYMAVPALVGNKKDLGRLKLLLPNLQSQSNLCLLFDYRLAGDKVGKLRVFVKNSNNGLAWEETKSQDKRWKTGKIQLYQGMDTTKSIIFEAERGKGKTGEIAVDGVLLISGFCPEDPVSVDG